jgi:hypothetical protein
MRQQAGGYAAILRWRGSLRTRWVHAAARSVRSPGTAARLDVVLPLRDGRATVSVTLLPDPVPAAQGARADYERQSREALG